MTRLTACNARHLHIKAYDKKSQPQSSRLWVSSITSHPDAVLLLICSCLRQHSVPLLYFVCLGIKALHLGVKLLHGLLHICRCGLRYRDDLPFSLDQAYLSLQQSDGFLSDSTAAYYSTSFASNFSFGPGQLGRTTGSPRQRIQVGCARQGCNSHTVYLSSLTWQC